MLNHPIHAHPCKMCVFVGTDKSTIGENMAQQVDCYVHPNPSGRLTLLRRYGSGAAQYGCCSSDEVSEVIPKYKRVLTMYETIREQEEAKP
jgi:hypothetical protein